MYESALGTELSRNSMYACMYVCVRVHACMYESALGTELSRNSMDVCMCICMCMFVERVSEHKQYVCMYVYLYVFVCVCL